MKPGRLLLLFLFTYSIEVLSQSDEKNWSLNGYIKDLVSINIPEEGDSILIDNLIHNRLTDRYFCIVQKYLPVVSDLLGGGGIRG